MAARAPRIIIGLGLILPLLLTPHTTASASRFCPTLPRPTAQDNIQFVASGDVQSLLRLLRQAAPHATLLLADGVYNLRMDQSLEINTPGLT